MAHGLLKPAKNAVFKPFSALFEPFCVVLTPFFSFFRCRRRHEVDFVDRRRRRRRRRGDPPRGRRRRRRPFS